MNRAQENSNQLSQNLTSKNSSENPSSDNLSSDHLSANNLIPENLVISLMAPTASGKTALAYELYDTGYFEIISVDSALIYRDMNIGTAKPTCEELKKYPHHLVNIIDPTETYSVANFVSDVERLVDEIHARGKIPLLVGGTMMYYMALFEGMSPVPETDFAIREMVDNWRKEAGIAALYDYLKQVDPIIADRLNMTDTQRITRAVEVYKQTGKALSDWQKLPKRAIADNPKQHWLGLAVMPDRKWLHQRIEHRLQLMWDAGFFDEVVKLLSNYSLTFATPSMRCVGYRQVIDYLVKTKHHAVESGFGHGQKQNNEPIMTTDKQLEVACQDMRNKALYATRQLAKRQYTWLRNMVATYSNASNKKRLNNKADDALPLHVFFKDAASEGTLDNPYSRKVVIDFADIEQAKTFILSYF